jgi:hypothetical protein
LTIIPITKTPIVMNQNGSKPAIFPKGFANGDVKML